MYKDKAPNSTVNLARLRIIALLPIVWFTFCVLGLDFIIGVLNTKNDVLQFIMQTVGIFFLVGSTLYLLVLIRREKWLIRIVLASMGFLLISVLCRAVRLYHSADPFLLENALILVRRFEILFNGLGLVSLIFAFYWAIIDLLIIKDDLTEKHNQLSLEISNRKQFATALTESEARYRGLYNSVKDGIVRVSLDGFIIETNDAYQNMLGYSPEELASLTYEDLTPSKWHEMESEIVRDQVFKRGYTDLYEKEYIRKDGTRFPVELRTWLINNTGGTPVAMWALVRDISERKRSEEEKQSLEAQIQYAQKLESLGVLAGGIAHDFNNILQIILGNVNSIEKFALDNSSSRPFTDNIKKSVDRAATLTHQMLAYSGRSSFSLQVLDLSTILSEITHLVQSWISKKISLKTDLAKGLPAIKADATQVQQVAMNLILNACEALDEEYGGLVTVSTEAFYCTKDDLSLNRALDKVPEGEYVCLTVSDTGHGMSEETKGRLFEPFFTTKFSGRGLGMAAVLGIIRGHKGAILIESTPGKGTSIKVFFPAFGPSQQEIPDNEPAISAIMPGRKSVILFVDDEPEMVELGVFILENMGHRVLTAGDGLEAVEVFKKRCDDIECVLLDLSMPRMDGGQALLEMRRIKPGVKVILASGYAEEELERKFSGQKVDGFLGKPYDSGTLAEKLQNVLG